MISVLYVDDEPVLLDICRLFLEKTGEFRVQTELSAIRALDRLSQESFDVIISDYQMPEMDGIEFLKKIRSENNSVPFIIFTGRGREEVAIAALKEGADFYLQKGGDPKSQFAELINQIRQVIRQRNAESLVHENEQKYHALFDSALDAFFILDNGIISECNRQMEQYFRRSRDQLIGMTPGELSPLYQSDGHLSSDVAIERMATALAGTPIIFEWKHSRSDGSEFDTEVSLNRFEIAGRFVLMSVLRDITVRKRNEEELNRKNEELSASYEELMSTEEELRTQYQITAQSEQALQKSQANLKAVIQGSPTPQFVIDQNHMVIHWNHALAAYSRIEADGVIGTDGHWRAFYSEKRPCLADLVLDGAIESIPQWYKNKFSKSPLIPDAYNAVDFFPGMGDDGTWLSFTASIVRDQDGRVIGALETLEDITTQKKASIALAESESRYRGVIENLQDSFYRSDIEGRIIMASPSIVPLLGYNSLDECIGKEIAVNFYANPVDRDVFRSEIAKTGSVTNYRVTLKKRDGSHILVSTSSHLYYDNDGKPAGIEGTFRDITRQVEDEERLKKSETILTAVIQESPVPLFVIDNDHRIIHWNRALELYSGIPVADVIGTDQQWRAFYPQERPCMADLLLLNTTNELPRWYPEKYAPSRLIDGAYEAVDYFPDIGDGGCWLYFTAAPIRDFDGRTIGAIEILQDITEQKKAEKENLDLNRFQESIIMNANVWLMVLDEKGIISVWNRAAEDISGYGYDEVTGGSWIWKALYPDPIYRKMITSQIRSIIDDNRYLQDFRTTIQTKHGEKKEILWNTRTLTQKNESHSRYVTIGVDISERIRAEEALRQSENTLQAIITGSPIPQFVIDKEHRVIQWNQALAVYSRIPAEEIIGTDQQWRAFYPDKRPCIADLIVDGVDISHGSYHENYQPSSLIEGGFQAIDFFPTMGNEGSWLFFTAAPIRDDQGRVIGAVETLEDVTERKWADHALMESEERFRTLFSNTTDAIFLHRITVDHHPGTFIEVNSAACIALGYSREELLTMSPHDIEAGDSPDLDNIYSGFQQEGGHITYETILRSRQDEEIPVEINAHVYEFKGERVILSIARNISDRRRYETALQTANKKLNLLSSITRHDILNQLIALTGYLALSEDIAKDEEMLMFIKKEKKVAETISRQILFTRDYQTIGVQSPRWQSLNMLIQQAASLLDTGNILVHIDVPSVAVYADPLLEKVFFNLIDNSVRYGREITAISFYTEIRDSMMILICSDDGGGIPPEEKENIFNLKYFNNTGFGLFLSREILAITGLTIVETGEYGEGVRFEIGFPEGSFQE